MNFGVLKSKFFQVIPSNFTPPIAETASPGPVVSVPTQGSWKFLDFLTLPTTTLGLPFLISVFLMFSLMALKKEYF